MVVCVWSWLIFVVLFLNSKDLCYCFILLSSLLALFFVVLFFALQEEKATLMKHKNRGGEGMRLRRFQRRREESGQGNSGTLGYGLGQKAD